MAETTGQRKKSWHESKHLRKRAAFLLENLDLIPTDVCFRIRTKNGKIKRINGHKIFFALASPVFHAELYGTLKEQGDVDISDVPTDAFHCLQKYIYTDSFDAISVANVVDVLAASKKYLMAKLTRYCYGFIQTHITAENSISLWLQAQDGFDDVVVEQTVAEIKRKTTAVVLSDGSLNLSQDQLLEMTSWQTLTIREFDLFQAVKKWKVYQGQSTGSSISCSRNEGGIFQNIRFSFLGPEQLADKCILEEVFTAEDVKEMFCPNRAGKELTTFSPRIREPAPSSFHLSIKYFVRYSAGLRYGEYKMIGSAEVVIWADVAPKACELLLKFVEKDYHFTTQHSVGRSDRGVVSCLNRKIPGSTAFPGISWDTLRVLRDEADLVEKQSRLWTAPDSVLMDSAFGADSDAFGTNLNIFNKKWQSLKGQLPNNNVTNETHGQRPAMVVGKVLSFTPELDRELEYMSKSSVTKNVSRAFECSVVETDS